MASPRGLLPEVAPQIDTNPTSFYTGKGSVRLRFRLNSPVSFIRSALATSVHPTYFNLTTRLREVALKKSGTVTYNYKVAKDVPVTTHAISKLRLFTFDCRLAEMTTHNVYNRHTPFS